MTHSDSSLMTETPPTTMADWTTSHHALQWDLCGSTADIYWLYRLKWWKFYLVWVWSASRLYFMFFFTICNKVKVKNKHLGRRAACTGSPGSGTGPRSSRRCCSGRSDRPLRRCLEGRNRTGQCSTQAGRTHSLTLCRVFQTPAPGGDRNDSQ